MHKTPIWNVDKPGPKRTFPSKILQLTKNMNSLVNKELNWVENNWFNKYYYDSSIEKP